MNLKEIGEGLALQPNHSTEIDAYSGRFVSALTNPSPLIVTMENDRRWCHHNNRMGR